MSLSKQSNAPFRFTTFILSFEFLIEVCESCFFILHCIPETVCDDTLVYRRYEGLINACLVQCFLRTELADPNIPAGSAMIYSS